MVIKENKICIQDLIEEENPIVKLVLYLYLEKDIISNIRESIYNYRNEIVKELYLKSCNRESNSNVNTGYKSFDYLIVEVDKLTNDPMLNDVNFFIDKFNNIVFFLKHIEELKAYYNEEVYYLDYRKDEINLIDRNCFYSKSDLYPFIHKENLKHKFNYIFKLIFNAQTALTNEDFNCIESIFNNERYLKIFKAHQITDSFYCYPDKEN